MGSSLRGGMWRSLVVWSPEMVWSRSDILRGPGLSSLPAAGTGLAMIVYNQSCVWDVQTEVNWRAYYRGNRYGAQGVRALKRGVSVGGAGLECTLHHPGSWGVADIKSVTKDLAICTSAKYYLQVLICIPLGNWELKLFAKMHVEWSSYWACGRSPYKDNVTNKLIYSL